ncbi:hypothetical protein [Novosphingobium sp. RL4]|uniref:hypothetical protein n=1 Tax=Novosphingobium sp. RL4 TaxID=3109595 RepID=UPI002D77B8CC|nr:hypothetical protein [Novosphingobium sp. RL4]WRT95997.1 hypothetical protein U9J33_20665 [Novosphingobium sp. RL4]
MTAAIRGRGIAARCTARLLGAQGLDWTLDDAPRPSGPAVMLSDPALSLMRDCLGDPELLAGKRRVQRRVVAWGGQEPATLDHGAIVLDEGDLDQCLEIYNINKSNGCSDFSIHAAMPFPSGNMRRFGSRPSGAAQVRLLREEDGDACRVESLDTGWLFLIPVSDTTGWLLAIGGSPDELLPQSRHLGARVELSRLSGASFETAPGMLECLAAPGWLACGTAAIAFDPICGDGTAQAVREAVLAAAVVQALAEGENAQALATHYHSMLLAAMRRHLKLCAQFYATGGKGAWWQAQLAALAEGFEWCTAALSRLPEPRYELRGLRLVPRETVT